jgi:hypothetical protein
MARVRLTIQQRVYLVQMHFKCLLENVADNFNASFQEGQFKVDKLYTTW